MGGPRSVRGSSENITAQDAHWSMTLYRRRLPHVSERVHCLTRPKKTLESFGCRFFARQIGVKKLQLHLPAGPQIHIAGSQRQFLSKLVCLGADRFSQFETTNALLVDRRQCSVQKIDGQAKLSVFTSVHPRPTLLAADSRDGSGADVQKLMTPSLAPKKTATLTAFFVTFVKTV
jgi:hypothetical protein